MEMQNWIPRRKPPGKAGKKMEENEERKFFLPVVNFFETHN